MAVSITSAFFAIEATIVQTFSDAVGPAANGGILGVPNLGLSQYELTPSTTTTLRASDSGYRSKSTDSIGVKAFPPTIAEAFQVDVAANLDPTQSGVAAAWGNLTLNNTDGAYNSLVSIWNNDGQRITIYRGVKTWDTTRGLWLDPAYATLVAVFIGLMGPWQVKQSTIQIALRDASYILETSYPRSQYGGTGGTDGTAAMAGTNKPLAYGGTYSTRRLQNITPVLVDAANLIYQYTDADGDLSAVYDGGLALGFGGFGLGAPAAGTYRVSFGSGMFQLGSTPVYNVTCDITGTSLATDSDLQTLTLLALNTMRVPSALIGGYGSGANHLETKGADATATAAAVGLDVAVYLGVNDNPSAMQFIEALLAPTGVYLVPCRDGKLRLFVLSAVPVSATVTLALNDSNIVSIEPATPASLESPVYRMRLAYARNWTVQTTGLAGAVSAARQAFLAQPASIAGAATVITVTTAAHLSDPAIIGQSGGSLATLSEAQTVVNNMVAVFGQRRRLYQVTVPASVGNTLDWGDVVSLTSDFDGLTTATKGQIVGWSYSSGSATQMLRVLV